tara:strand:- start:171 stop:662 length:492 start_codon:yes stop_codon:yes gene_type:complete
VHEHAVRPVPSHLGHSSSASPSSPPRVVAIAPYAAKITPHVAACSTHHDVSNACGNAARSTRRAVDPPLARAFPRPRIRRPPSSSSLARVTARATPVLTARPHRASRVVPRVARARAVVAFAVVTVDMTANARRRVTWRGRFDSTILARAYISDASIARAMMP